MLAVSMREYMSRSDNNVIVGHLAQTRERERREAAEREQRERREAAEWERREKLIAKRRAAKERDAAYRRLMVVAYQRDRKFIPKRKELRDEMNEALRSMAAWAALAAPDHPARPPVRDPEYPPPDRSLSGRAALENERERLIVWADILEDRGEMVKAGNVMANVYRLEIRLGLRRRRRELVRDGRQMVMREHYVFVGRR